MSYASVAISPQPFIIQNITINPTLDLIRDAITVIAQCLGMAALLWSILALPGFLADRASAYHASNHHADAHPAHVAKAS